MRPFSPSRTQALHGRLNEASLPDLCTVHLVGDWTDDLEGGGSYGEGTDVSFACRTWPLSAQEMETLVADQLRQPGLEGMVMALGQELPINATIEIARFTSGAIDHYEVLGRIPDATYATKSKAIIKRISPPEAEG